MATIHATTVWKVITSTALFHPPSSLFTAAMAATHGIYSREKVRNENADSGVNICDSSGMTVEELQIVISAKTQGVRDKLLP